MSAAEFAADGQGAPAPPLSNAARSYAMSVLLSISIINYLDRQVINILAEPIKIDLGLADWQLGMLTGLAFGVLYTFLGLPIARLAERGNRPLIIATATAVWSLFTLACGFAQNFVQLALARVGVGVGEAGGTPPSHSLIMDYAPSDKRSSALAMYGLGPPIGSLLGLAFGGIVADAYGWRTAFLIAGAPGLLLAALAALSLVEPRKAKGQRTVTAPKNQTSIGEMFKLVSAKRSYWTLGAAIVLTTFAMIGQTSFIASFYLRNHPEELAAFAASGGQLIGADLGSVGFLGIALGLISGIGGALGTWIGGRIGDRLAMRDARWFVLLPGIALLLGVPTFAGGMLAESLGFSLLLYGLSVFVTFFWYGPTFTAWFSLVPETARATNSALVLFVSNLVGLGLGPLLVGVFSDYFALSMGPAEGLRWSLMTMTVVGVVTGLLFLASARTFREDMIR